MMRMLSGPCSIALVMGFGLAGAAVSTGCSDDTTYPSLPGPRPEGCDRPIAYDEDDLTADLAYLASPELDGRYPGTQGDVEARNFIAERFSCLGLEDVGNLAGYTQSFTNDEDEHTANVLAMIPGADPSVADESIIITAHIDHLGDGYLGASDNASGLAALLAIAQDMTNRNVRPDRTLVFAAVGSEEPGFEGSEYFVTHPPSGFDPDRIVYNINMDMVGSYDQSGTLYALGTFEGEPGTTAVSSNTSNHPGIDVSLGDYSDQSDNVSFCTRGIPYVFFWTEDEECYHERCDTSSRIDFESLSEIAALTGEVALDLANSTKNLLGNVQHGEDVCY